ncbi:hypothetical protein J3T65_05215 [Staphylococcus simiae]|uniref:hypothetical protein n=1 Tax=Staphylococcus simiae TaxID=308354 RepID=UPI001A966DA2|nr:hypothetical protein [Staphylococcus simiae]MBO1199115.1 hypothetical protein [Staphylococcus simiae]MBO1201177.1 hypothetical protein [Staphylococcus simiae]MBO1203325.1 hypothetical protein [Staphylococcus simiae]MBO1210853.1 hypothetical protein [Staphylococcus simiae]MBO1229553.1 hypothetical protein [Staphylococcus simiae]
MRYQDRIVIFNYKSTRYDPITKSRLSIKENETEITCYYNELNAEATRLEFGEVVSNVAIARLSTRISSSPTHATIHDKLYKVLKIKQYHNSTSLFLKEVTNHESDRN